MDFNAVEFKNDILVLLDPAINDDSLCEDVAWKIEEYIDKVIQEDWAEYVRTMLTHILYNQCITRRKYKADLNDPPKMVYRSTEYANSIKTGKKIACIELQQAVDRFLNDLNNPEYELDPTGPEFCIQIIEKTIKHQQGERLDGTPLRGEPFLLEPFHKFIIYNLIGFKLKGTDIVRFHEALIFIPRKNIKTSFAASLAWALSLLERPAKNGVSFNWKQVENCMYERMLNKQEEPTIAQMMAYCGACAELFTQLNEWLSGTFGTTQAVTFPYGNGYGWGVVHRKNKKLICHVFAEENAFTVMMRLSNKQFDSIYGKVQAGTRGQIDHKYPCGDGGWLHYRVTCREQLDDIQTLLTVKCT